MVFCVKMMVGLRIDGFLCEDDGRASRRWLFYVKMMVGQMVFLFLRLKGGFALLRPPRGPPELVCPFGANEEEARPWVLDEKAVQS
jgi:hypothetical protein